MLLVFISSVFVCAATLEPEQLNYELGQWQFSASGNDLATTANYTKSGGEYVDLPSGYSYNLAQFDFLTRWVAMPRLGTYASTQIAYAQSKDFRDTRSNSSFTEATVGMDFELLGRKNWDAYVDFSASFPFQRVDPKSDDVLIHEGAMVFRPALGFRYWLGSVSYFANSGFQYRDEDRASLIDYILGAEMHPKNWIFGAAVEGFSTLIKDSRTNSAQKEQVFARNGNSLRFFSTDPSVLQAKIWAGFGLSKDIQFKVGLANTMTGSAYAAGLTIFANLLWSPNTQSHTSTSFEEQSRSNSPSEFKEDTNDGVDQKYFEPTPEQKAPTPEDSSRTQTLPPAKERPPSLRPPRQQPTKKHQKAAKRTNHKMTKEQLKNELDQAEFQIELKTSKKKKKKPQN